MSQPEKPIRDSQSGATLPIWQSAWFNTAGRFLALAVVFLFFAVLVEDGKFYSLRNLENILRQSAVYATAALGMTMVIIAAGIDLSIGSIISSARSNLLCCQRLRATIPTPIANTRTSNPTMIRRSFVLIACNGWGAAANKNGTIALWGSKESAKGRKRQARSMTAR